MSIQAATEPADFKRDGNNRPLVVPAEGGKTKPYTRASSAAKTTEDTYNLEQWARRNVAYGMATDASLVARLLAIGGAPDTWDRDTKREVGNIVGDAETVAKAHKGADIGTAVHKLTEQLDRGEEVNAGPYQEDLEAYAVAMNEAGLDIRPEYVECRIVCDELEMAGTADRIVETADGVFRIADIKTGATVDFGALGWAAQLAAYANGQRYDPADDSRTALKIDDEVGYIIHLPAGQGTCAIYTVDLVAGMEAARLANAIRETRKQSKKWLTLVAQHTELVPTDDLVERVQGFNRADRDAIKAEWGDLPSIKDGAPVTQEQYNAIAALLDRFDVFEQTQTELSEPKELPAPPEPTPALPRQEVDEGGDADPDAAEQLVSKLKALEPDDLHTLHQLAAEAAAGPGQPISLKTPTVRRYEIARGLLALWQLGWDTALVRELLAAAMESDEARQESVPIGDVLSILDAGEAETFAELAHALNFDDENAALVATPAEHGWQLSGPALDAA